MYIGYSLKPKQQKWTHMHINLCLCTKADEESINDVRTHQQKVFNKWKKWLQKVSKSVLQCKPSFCSYQIVKAVLAIKQRGYIQLEKLNYIITLRKCPVYCLNTTQRTLMTDFVRSWLYLWVQNNLIMSDPWLFSSRQLLISESASKIFFWLI